MKEFSVLFWTFLDFFEKWQRFFEFFEKNIFEKWTMSNAHVMSALEISALQMSALAP
jgi:hypothetical protein